MVDKSWIWKPWYYWLCFITFGHNWFLVNVVNNNLPAIEKCGACNATRWARQKKMLDWDGWPYFER